MPQLIPEDFVPIQFKEPQEFKVRRAYQPRLTCENDQLDRIIGKYSFSKEQQLECGLNGCNQNHWHGWVIRTKNGEETHCGRNCGERQFDVLFKEVEAVYRAAVERQSKRERLEQLSRDRESLLVEATTVYDQVSLAASRIQSIVDELKRDAVLYKAFNDCVKGRGRIQVEDEDSKRLRAAMGAASGRADLKTIGMIHGWQAVTAYSSTLLEIRYKVISPLRELTTENILSLSDKELTAKTQSFIQIEQTVSSAKHFLRDFEQFNSPANSETFPLLAQVIPRKARTARVSRIIDKLTRSCLELASPP